MNTSPAPSPKPTDLLFVFVGNRTAREEIIPAHVPGPDWASLLLHRQLMLLFQMNQITAGSASWMFQDALGNVSVGYRIAEARRAAALAHSAIQMLAAPALLRLSVHEQGRWLEIHSPADGRLIDNPQCDAGELALAFHKFSESHRRQMEKHFGVSP